jgi:arylsulfatase
VYNYLALDLFEVASNVELPVGDLTLRYEFVPTGPLRFQEGKGPAGHATLYVDDRLVGAIEMAHTTPNRVGPVGFSCGYAAFDTVQPGRYRIPFRFTGTIHRVTYDVTGDGMLHDEAEFQALMSQQ